MSEVKVNPSLAELSAHDARVVHVVKQLCMVLLALVRQLACVFVLQLGHAQTLIKFLDPVQMSLNGRLSVDHCLSQAVKFLRHLRDLLEILAD